MLEQCRHELAAARDQFPRTGPETHIDGPPLDIRHRQQARREVLKVDEALTEGAMRAGFISVQRAVAIDQVDRADAAR